MTLDQYWHGDPWLTVFYRQKHNLDIESRNQELWLQGYYIHNAIATNFHNAFSDKGRRAEKYIEKPIRITPLTEREKRIEADTERRKTIEWLNRLKKSFEQKEAPNA